MLPWRVTFAVLRIVARTGGARLLERAVPLFVGLTIGASVLFSPQGLEARDVSQLASESFVFRAALWAAWLLASVPLTAALLRERRSDFLRALPVPAWLGSLAGGLFMVVAQLPWTLLWLRGSGVAGGLAACVLGVALSVLLATRRRAAFERLLLAACSAAIVLGAPAWIALGLAPLVALACHRAWLTAPERPEGGASRVRGPAPVALASAHHLRLVRSERFAVLRGLFVASLGGAAAALAARNTGHRDAAFMLAVIAPALVLAASGVTAPLLDADESVDALLRSSGASRLLRRGALAAVAAGWGAVFGIASFAAARGVAGTAMSTLAPSAILGSSLAALAVVAARKAGGTNEGGRRVLFFGALAGGAVALAAWIGEAAVLVLGVLAVASWLLDAGRQRRAPLVDPSGDLLVVDGLHKRLGGNDVLIGASLSLPPGCIAVVRGVNGCGKSTLLRIIGGLIDKDAGSIHIAGRSLDAERSQALSSVGYAPDAAELPEHLSVREILALVAVLRGVDSGGAAASLHGGATPARPAEEERLGVRAFAHQLLGSLSLGQRRRVSLLSALIGRPPLLLLDEPTNGLDAAGLDVLDDILSEHRARGGSVLVASHEPAFGARIADTSLTLARGVLRPT